MKNIRIQMKRFSHDVEEIGMLTNLSSTSIHQTLVNFTKKTFQTSAVDFSSKKWAIPAAVKVASLVASRSFVKAVRQVINCFIAGRVVSHEAVATLHE